MCSFLGIFDALVGECVFLGGAGVVAENEGDPRSLTEKGLRRPELLRRPESGGLGILEDGADLEVTRRGLQSTSDNGDDIAGG